MQEPDIKIAGFSLWVRGRERPDANDYCDGNWLDARALVEAPGCLVETTGSFLRTDDIRHFLTGLERIDRDLVGEAELSCLEPNLGIKVSCEKLGGVTFEVSITPDHLVQSHNVIFVLDQTYLKPAVRALGALLARFPVRGRP